MIIHGGPLALIIFIVVGIYMAIKHGFSKGGCGTIVSLTIIGLLIWLFVKSCEFYNENESDYRKSPQYGHEYDYKKQQHSETQRQRQSINLYYPTREIDSIAGKPLATGNENWYRTEGYSCGERDGKKDAANKTPYKSYYWGSLFKEDSTNEFSLGYWTAYKQYYPDIPKLSNDEVKKRMAEAEKEFQEYLKKQKAAHANHSNSYDEGYSKGYSDGADDAQGGLGYLTSFDKSCKKVIEMRAEYERGYTNGYENGYNDYEN